MPPGRNDGEATTPHEMNGANAFRAEMAGQGTTAEIAADEKSAFEMPGDDGERSELPSTPRTARSRASMKKLPPTPPSSKTQQSSVKRSLRLTTVPKRKPLPGCSKEAKDPIP